MQDIEKLHYYIPQNERERIVKRIFMIETLTGARNEDARTFGMRNLHSRTNTLSYVCQKTKHEVNVPVHKWLKKYLVENDKDAFTKQLSLSTINDTLRHMCYACRIGEGEETTLYRRGKQMSGEKYKFVSSHTGRRSFATNLFILGCDPFSIARFMGHANPNTTIENYIIGYREVPEHAMQFFNPQNHTA